MSQGASNSPAETVGGSGRGSPLLGPALDDQATFNALMANMMSLIMPMNAQITGQQQVNLDPTLLSQIPSGVTGGMATGLATGMDGPSTQMADLAALFNGQALGELPGLLAQTGAVTTGQGSMEVLLGEAQSQLSQMPKVPLPGGMAAQSASQSTLAAQIEGMIQAGVQMGDEGNLADGLAQLGKAQVSQSGQNGTQASPISPEALQGLQASLGNGQGTMQNGQGSQQQSQQQQESPVTAQAVSAGANTQTAAPTFQAVDGAQKPAVQMTAAPAQQVADQVRVSLNQGEQTATVSLQPEHLGKVNIRMEMVNGELHLSINAEQQQTGRLLEQKVLELRSNLENQGIRVGDLAVVNSRNMSAEGAQREVISQLRTNQMDFGGNLNQQQQSQQQQAALAGGFQQSSGERSLYGRNGPSGSQTAGQAGGQTVGSSMAGMTAQSSAWQPGVDYYA